MDYGGYPTDATYLRPLDPHRSQTSTGNTGISGPPRQSTVTWISQSQFAQRAPPTFRDAPTIPSIHSRNSYDEPANYDRYPPANQGYEDDYVEEPITPGPPRSDAEHMTVDAEAVGSAENGGAPRARGSFVGGFMRKVFGKGARPETGSTDFEQGTYGSNPPSFLPRDVTYVDTSSTIPEDPVPPRRPLYSQYTGASVLQSVAEQDSPEMRDRHSELGSEHGRSQGRRSREGSAVNGGEYERYEGEGGGLELQDADGTTAVHHGAPFHGPAVMNSPVFNEPLPTSDYDKMSAFHTAPSELYSISSYIDRVAMFFRDLYDLPWMATQVTEDYIPGENSRSKYERFKMRHATRHGSLGPNSWYALPTHQDLDLLEGEGSQAGGPARHQYRTPQYAMSENYPSTPFPYVPPHPQYYQHSTDPGSGTGVADEREYERPPLRSHLSHDEESEAGAPSEGPLSPPLSPPHPFPPSVGWAPQVTITAATPTAATPPRSYADRTVPTASHTMRSPEYGNSSVGAFSPRTDRTIDTNSHTAISTVRGPRRERGTEAGTAGSEVSARSGDGRRRSRVSWYSSEGTPTTPTQHMFGYGGPSSPTAYHSGMGRHGPSGLGRHATGGSVSGRSERSAGGRSAGGRSANGSAAGGAPGAWPEEMRQTQQMPVMLSAPTPSPPASPPRMMTSRGSPRRNRYEHTSAAVYASPPRSSLVQFATKR